MLSTAHPGGDEASPPSSGSSLIPTDIDKAAIVWLGNPAHLSGVLHEATRFYARKNLFQPFFRDRSVLLGNGKMAVDSAQAVPFCKRISLDPDTYNFMNPCPDTDRRISAYDAAAAAAPTATPGFTRVNPDREVTGYVVSPWAVDGEDAKLCQSLLNIIGDSDKRSYFEEAALSSGTRLIALLIAEGNKATAKDNALVTEHRNLHCSAGIQGEVNLDTFNAFYSTLNKLQRYTPPAFHKSDVEIIQIINNLMFKDGATTALWEIKLEVSRPTTLTEMVDLVRDFLRGRNVTRDLASATTASGAPTFAGANIALAATNARRASSSAAVAHTAIANAAQSIAFLEGIKASGSSLSTTQQSLLTESKALIAGPDPNKRDRRPNKRKDANFAAPASAPKATKFLALRDPTTNVVTHWVEGMEPCSCGKEHLYRD